MPSARPEVAAYFGTLVYRAEMHETGKLADDVLRAESRLLMDKVIDFVGERQAGENFRIDITVTKVPA